MEGNRELSAPSLPPTTNKSLTNMGTHLVVARNLASDSHHGEIHGEGTGQKTTEKCPPPSLPPTANKSLTAVGTVTRLVVAGNRANDSHHGQIHEEEMMEGNRELSTPFLPHKVFDKRGYPPYCCRKSSRQQPPWWDTWRRNWAERQHRRWTFRCSAAWTTTSAVLCWSRQTGSLSWT